MRALQRSVPAKSFDAAIVTASAGTVYALLPFAQLVTWQTSFAVNPVAINIIIETSLDNSSWNTSATTTAIAGEIGTFITSASFIRASIVSHTSGTGVTVNIVSSPGLLSTQQQITGGIADGQVTFGSATNTITGSDNFEYDNTNQELNLQAIAGGGDHTFNITDSDGNDEISLYADESPAAQVAIGLQGIGTLRVGTGVTIATINSNSGTGVDLELGRINNHPLMKIASDSITMLDPTGSTTIFSVDATGIVEPTGYNSADGSAGISTTITTGSLVGKTITVKDGIITGFA